MGTAERTWVALSVVALLTGACAADAGDKATVGAVVHALGTSLPVATTTEPAAVEVSGMAPATAAPAPAAPSPPSTAAPSTAAPSTSPPTAPPVPRVVSEQAWTPFAQAGDVTLVHPSSRVERVGFHQSNHDGARDLEPLATVVAGVTMEGRDRDTSPRGAADVVVDPQVEIRAPVTGTVKRAGRYVLYCRHSDDFVVIAPDSHPGWEVKMLHIDGVRVRAGERVVAGQTVLAPRPTQLPFESQVDELSTVAPAWPHVHIEVVDPTIPDRPTPGGGCA